MKKFTLVPLVVSLLLFLSVASQAAAPTKLRLQGDQVTASFYTYDPLTCVATGVSVAAYETLQQTAGAPATGRSLHVDVYSYNDCDGTRVLAASAFVELTRAELYVQGGAQSARVQKSLAIQDYFTGETVPVTVNLTWTGIGEPTRSTSHEGLHAEFAHYSAHSTAVSRQADVTGSISLGSTNLIAETSSPWGTISHSNSGTVTHN